MVDWLGDFVAAKSTLIAKVMGAAFGAAFSVIMIPPRPGSRGNAYRIAIGFIGGLIFWPVTQRMIPFFSGESGPIIMAATCATAFACYSVLETIARLLSQEDTFTRFLEEMIRLKKGGGDKK